jgi:predicted regulator of Ras-like GTPase activity (Roadblock/LC7/MglB family)
MNDYGKIDAIYLSTWDAHPICSISRGKMDSAETSVVSSVMVKLGDLAVSTLDKGKLETVYIQGKEGYVFIRKVGKDMVLTVSTRKDVSIGFLLFKIEDLARRVLEVSSIDHWKPPVQEANTQLAEIIE